MYQEFLSLDQHSDTFLDDGWELSLKYNLQNINLDDFFEEVKQDEKA